jgi:hypothetical protein
MTIRRRVLVAAAAGGLAVLTAPAALALDPDTIAVPPEFSDGRALIVRPGRIDVVSDGRVQRTVPLEGALDLAELPRLIADPRYVSAPSRGVVRLSATLAQRPGSRIDGAGPALTRLQLAPGGIRLTGTRSTLHLETVRIETAPGPRRAAPAVGSRAAIRYTHGSRLELTDVNVVGLGPTGTSARAAVEATEGTAVRLTRVRIAGSGRAGLRLIGVRGASLTNVVAEAGGGDGIIVARGSRVQLSDVVVRGNRGDGVVVRGPVPDLRTSGPVSATGNGGNGIVLTGLDGVVLRRLRTGANRGAGVNVRDSRRVDVGRVRSVADRTGVAVTGSGDVRLARITTTGSATGIVVKDSDRVELATVVVSGARDEGIGVAARGVTVTDADVSRSGEGLVIGDGATAVAVRDSRLSGDRSGLRVTEAAADVVVRGVEVRSRSGVAIRGGGTRTTLTDVVVGGAVGLDLRGEAVLNRVRVSASNQALRVLRGGRVEVRDSELTAGRLGIGAARDAEVTVVGSRLEAQRATRGPVDLGDGNDVSALPIRWVGIAGLAAMLLAVALEVIRKTRERGDGGVHAPLHVLNRT